MSVCKSIARYSRSIAHGMTDALNIKIESLALCVPCVHAYKARANAHNFS